jgi:hypothetical protein
MDGQWVERTRLAETALTHLDADRCLDTTWDPPVAALERGRSGGCVRLGRSLTGRRLSRETRKIAHGYKMRDHRTDSRDRRRDLGEQRD